MAARVTIRRAVAGDEAALGRLGAALVAAHHDFDAERFMAAGPETERGYGRFLVSQLAAKDALVLVADQGGVVLGYVYAGVEGADWMALRGPAGVVHDLVVDPARRSQGVGRQLLGRALAELAARGVPRVVLSAAHKNEGAQRLFAAAGFRPTMLEMTREWAQEPPEQAQEPP